jgi:hypothetical protein
MPFPARFTGTLALSTLLAASAMAADPGAQTCRPEERAELLAAPTAAKRTYQLKCSIELKPSDLVRKEIWISGAEASGVRLNCNGATLGGGFVQGQRTDRVLTIASIGESAHKSRPENIQILQCNIVGKVFVRGWNHDELRRSARHAGHTLRAQEAAPKNILIDRTVITTSTETPLYVGAGVTHLTISRSKITGESKHGPAIYLDQESGFNRILDNYIAVATEGKKICFLGQCIKYAPGREQIAVDGSADNLISGNHFGGLNHGGIYLYRNCGERGVIRHQAPQRNVISNNRFFYRHYTGSNPAIWLGSRNGGKGYCDQDAGFPFGSSANDNDEAFFNEVKENRFVNRSPRRYIRDHGRHNDVHHNFTEGVRITIDADDGLVDNGNQGP